MGEYVPNTIDRSSRFWWLGGFLVTVVGLAALLQACKADPGRDTMNQADMGLWRVVDALAQQIPFSKQKVETVLSTRLKEENRNDYTVFFEGVGGEPDKGVVISNVDLRLKLTGKDPGFLVLDISGACVTIDQVRARYGDIELTGMPRGSSLEEEFNYSKFLPWGRVSFGFKEEKPDCLSSISFHPKGS